MRISDEERNEIARKLREVAKLNDVNAATDGELLDVIAYGIGMGSYGGVWCSALLNKLADLIELQSVEPEAVTIYVGPDSREMNVWACPACGNVVSYFFDDYDPKTDGPRYCSGCGRKVAKW